MQRREEEVVQGTAKRVVTRGTLVIQAVVAAVLLCAGLGTTIVAPLPAAAAPDPNSVYVESITYGGTGCPLGSVGTSIPDNRLSFTLIFDSFVASTGAGIPVTEARKTCQFSIALNAPDGWTWTVVAVDARGYVQLPSGVTATVSTRFEFAGHVATSQKAFTGPTNRDYLYRAKSLPLVLSAGECGGDGVLTVNQAIGITGPAGTSAQITSDSLDVSLSGGTGSPAGVQIAWYQCSPLCFDNTSGTTVTATKWLTEPGTLTGTSGDDVLVGSLGSDTIKGQNGDDVICGAPYDGPAGDPDDIEGGSGSDSITGTGHLDGGSSDDSIHASGAGTVADGGSGDDQIAGSGASTLLGGSGSDTVLNLDGTPKIDCGAAYDEVYANGATDVRRCEGTTNPPI